MAFSKDSKFNAFCPVCHLNLYRPSSPCLNCLAGLRRKESWRREEDLLIEELYGTVRLADLQHQLFLKTRIPRSFMAIGCRAGKLKVKALTNFDGLTVTEAALELGVHHSYLTKRIKKGVLKSYGTGLHTYISTEDFLELKKSLVKLPSDAITIVEAAKILGYDRTQLYTLVTAKVIEGYYRLGKWYTTRREVERLTWRFKVTGATRLTWPSTEEMERHRERTREGVKKMRSLKEDQK